jgi:hypothetical protein
MSAVATLFCIVLLVLSYQEIRVRLLQSKLKNAETRALRAEILLEARPQRVEVI